MERKSGNQGNLKHADHSSSSGKPVLLIPSSNKSSSSGTGPREQEQFMPIANVIRIMRRVVPGHAKISDDAKETVQECVSEFISFVTGEANDRCQREQRKTVTAEDILWAMAKLGFDDYVHPLSIFLSRLRASSAGEPLAPGPVNEPYGGSLGGAVAHHHHQVGGSGAPYVAGLNLNEMAQYQGFLDAIAGGYSRDGAGGAGGSGGSSLENGGMGSYDPYAHFK